jgi:RND family efflux transporter, MFP subunit
MKRRPLLLSLIALVLLVAGWTLLQSLRGPMLPAYEVVAQPLVQTVVATGRVAAYSRVQVGSEITGVVVERLVQEGDQVRPGDVLAVLRADDLEAAVREAEAALATLQQSTRPQAEAALREAEAALAQASREVERRRDLMTRQLISSEALEQAVQAEISAQSAADKARLAASALAAGQPDEVAAQARLANAKAQLAKTTIRAQVAGTVLTRNAEPGDLVQPGRVLFELTREGATELLVPVDEKNLEALQLGQSAVCVADAYPNHPFPAKLTFIAPSIDPARGTVDIRLTVDPSPAFLREGMTVSVNVETGKRERALSLPNDALVNIDGNSAEVWVATAGRTERRKVQLGLRGVAATEIASGLQEGDWVLANPDDTVGEGERVRLVPTQAPIGPAPASTSNEVPVRFN